MSLEPKVGEYVMYYSRDGRATTRMRVLAVKASGDLQLEGKDGSGRVREWTVNPAEGRVRFIPREGAHAGSGRRRSRSRSPERQGAHQRSRSRSLAWELLERSRARPPVEDRKKPWR